MHVTDDRDVVLRLDGPDGSRELTRDELEALSDRNAAERAGRWAEGCAALHFRSLASHLPAGAEATHATFHAADGYAVSITLDQAMVDALVLVPAATTGRVGVRLIVAEGHTTCLNVKAVTRVELTAGPGKHTVDPEPHENAFVDGWDG